MSGMIQNSVKGQGLTLFLVLFHSSLPFASYTFSLLPSFPLSEVLNTRSQCKVSAVLPPTKLFLKLNAATWRILAHFSE